MIAKKWLSHVPWELVVWQNEQLCNFKKAHHGPTTDGHDPCRDLWVECHQNVMRLDEMVELCRKCHRLAPFTNYNGNTFAAIARSLIDELRLPSQSAAIIRSLAGHIVAGVASEEEIDAFRKFCNALE
ncbi:MAG: hypothetical protein RLZ22_1219 [Verrucomicrobiota bacterium]|jgi:hypothetical protein